MKTLRSECKNLKNKKSTVILLLFLLMFAVIPIQFFKVPQVNASDTKSITRIQGPTNPSIIGSNLTDYSLMANGTYQAYFKSNSKTANSVMFQNKGYNFSMDISTSQLHWYNSTYNAIIGMVAEMNPQNTVVSTSENTLTYSGAWINTDLQYQALYDCLKETLIINGVSAPSSSIKPDYLQYVSNCYFNNSLTIYANGVGYLHPSSKQFTTNGTIDFNDANNATVFWLPPPVISDSAGNQTSGLYAVTANNGILVVNIRMPKSFIDHAVFPLFFDPTVRVQGNARGTSGASNTVSVTMGDTPIEGNILVATIGTRYTSSVRTVSSIAQTGVTWTKQINTNWSTGAYLDSEIWFGVVGSGASTSITVTLSNTATAAVADVCEYSGIFTSNFLDKTATNGSSSTTAPNTGITDQTSQTIELCIGSTVATLEQTGGDLTFDGALYGGSVSVGYEEEITTSQQTVYLTTTTADSTQFAGCIATFKSLDTTSPTYSDLSTSTIYANTTCQFNAIFNDDEALHPNGQYQFGTNNTGSWVWDSAVNFTATPQSISTAKTLNSTVGSKVSYEWNFTDNVGNKNDTGIQTFTTADGTPPILLQYQASPIQASASCNFTAQFQDEVDLSGWIFNSNETGTSINSTWASFSANPDWANVTKTLPSLGATVSFQWFANDTSNNWVATTLLSITTTNSLAPTYSDITYSTSSPNTACTFSCLWQGTYGMSGFIFSINTAGTWTNNTWTALSGNPVYASAVASLPSSGTVQFMWYANDTSDNWNSTSIQSFQVVAGGGGGGGGYPPTYSPSPSPSLTPSPVLPSTTPTPTPTSPLSILGLASIVMILGAVTLIAQASKKKKSLKHSMERTVQTGVTFDTSGISKTFSKTQKSISKSLSTPSKTLSKHGIKVSTVSDIGKKLKEKLKKNSLWKDPLD
jgi:hypothetical protein